jgi:hypothetical protein
LEQLRSDLLAAGAVIERPLPQSGEAGEDLSDWQQKIAALLERLTHDVPIDPADRSHEQHARWILAHTLDWHRRENKAVWWDYFRLSALSAEELVDERVGLSGLTFIESVGGTAKAPIHRYHFPPQDTDLRGDEDLRQGGQPESIDKGPLDPPTGHSRPNSVLEHADISVSNIGWDVYPYIVKPVVAILHFINGRIFAPALIDDAVKGSHQTSAIGTMFTVK